MNTSIDGCATLAALALALCGCSEPTGGTRIVLVTLDTLRYDCVAAAEPAMPLLAASAERGARFERCYAASSTTQPTHASLFTGLHAWEHRVHRNGTVLDESARTAAEVLRGAGWWTGAAIASFPLHRRFGFAQGFDVYRDEFTAEWASAGGDENDAYTPCQEVTDRALELLDEADADRQFLWVHYFDAHAPYGDDDPERMRVKQLARAAKERSPDLTRMIARARGLYDRDASRLDRELARLLERLREDERWQTHVIVTADHGESFGDDGWFGHGSSLSDEQVRVPLILLSDRVAPGARADPVGSVDVATTLLALAGLPDETLGHGRDLTRPVESGATICGMRRTYSEPNEEVLIDGSVRELQGTLLFYAFVDGRRAIGNAQGVEGLTDDAATGALALFAAFESELAKQPTRELLDTATQDRLQQLGYTR